MGDLTPNYRGDGSITREPDFKTTKSTDPRGYRAERGLVAAVNAALRLKMPLMLTGSPGIGKTQLAYSLAYELNMGEPLRFVVKSDTRARDLLYDFDTVGRFHAANIAKAGENSIDPRRFLTFSALGKAILYSYTKEQLEPILGPALYGLKLPSQPRRSVILIDEIDKAPRDVPNDLLAEIEELSFSIPELATVRGNVSSDTASSANILTEQKEGPIEPSFKVQEPKANTKVQEPKVDTLEPIIIITSNSERSLPDAFMRRCLYYDVPFPKFGGNNKNANPTVLSIVASRLGDSYESHQTFFNSAIDLFRHIREQDLERKPGLAELLNWLNYLKADMQLLNVETLKQVEELDSDDKTKQRLIDGIKVTLLKHSRHDVEAKSVVESWIKSCNQQ